MTDVEVLMKDGCTKAEAENHLKNGTQIISDFEKHFADYMIEWSVSAEDYKRMIETKIPLSDWGIVQTGNNTYYIAYVL